MLLYPVQTLSYEQLHLLLTLLFVNPNSIKTLFANGLSIFFNKSKPVFRNGPTKTLTENPPYCPILCN